MMSAFNATKSAAECVGGCDNASSCSAHSIILVMASLPVDIYSVATVREIDRTAIEDEAIPGYTLMSRAGAAAVSEGRSRFPDAKRWQVVCGAGNNAGDGYVVARLAASEGIVVSVVALVDPVGLRGDAATAFGDFAAEGGVVSPWAGQLDPDADLIVDGLLGSGLERDVEGEFALAVSAMNAHAGKVVALDVPTGLHADSGAVMGFAVRADLTVTFVGLKAGLFLGDGRDYSGEVAFAGLGIPAKCRQSSRAELRRIDDGQLQRTLAPRRRASHKGDFGHVLIVGGGAGMPGAVRLCGEAALRTGAGRVSIATDPGHAAMIVATRPELMSHAVRSASELQALLGLADVIAVGPGLGRSPWAGELFEALAEDCRPCVWDADALNWLAESASRQEQRIITPHPGEAATLLALTVAEVQSDRRSALNRLEERYAGVVVLKGAGTLVSSATGAPWLCTSGNPGMASPGMGDVLTGIIAALLAQGLVAEDAAAVGVEVHARAGDRATASGERGLLASDLFPELRGIINL
jgi:NAD(P)H-hydrate epimerase